MLDRAQSLGVRNVVFGMPHRGRLNVLCNVMRKDTALIFKEFGGAPIDGVEKFTQMMQEEDFVMSGDVKYHLGTSSRREYADGQSMRLSLVANPSHLETVNPVVCGKARARMYGWLDICARAGARRVPSFSRKGTYITSQSCFQVLPR